MGTNILGMSESEFWKSTPRKLMAIFDVHKQVQGIETSGEETEVYADQIPFL